MAYCDPAEGRRKDRDRTARLTAARIAAGLCTRCGKTEPLSERRLCARCNNKRNAASRARDARLRAEGRRRLCAAIAQPSRAAATAPTASRTMASDRWMYFSVVAGLR